MATAEEGFMKKLAVYTALADDAAVGRSGGECFNARFWVLFD